MNFTRRSFHLWSCQRKRRAPKLSLGIPSWIRVSLRVWAPISTTWTAGRETRRSNDSAQRSWSSHEAKQRWTFMSSSRSSRRAAWQSYHLCPRSKRMLFRGTTLCHASPTRRSRLMPDHSLWKESQMWGAPRRPPRQARQTRRSSRSQASMGALTSPSAWSVDCNERLSCTLPLTPISAL